MGEIEISFDLGRLKKFLILGFLVAVLAVELMLTYNNPIAFGDEGFHVSTAKYIGTQIDFSKYTPLYGSDLSPERFSRPPLWNLVEASFYFLFGFSEDFVKFLVPFISFMTGLAIYAFGRKLYSENVGIVAAAVAVTIPSFVTYSVLFYTTVPYVFFFTIGFLSLLTAVKTGEKKWWVLSGIFSGLAILANIAGLFMPALVVLMGIIHLIRNRSMHGLVRAVKTYGLALILIALVVSPLFARNFALFRTEGCDNPLTIFQGGCPEPGAYQPSTANQFVGRTSGGGTEESILNVGVSSYLQFAYGFGSSNGILNIIGLAFVPFSFLAGLVIIAKRREASDIALLASTAIFILIFFQFGGLVEGRSEDTARYFLSAAPLIGLAAGSYWSSVRKDGHKLNGLIILTVLIVVLALAFFSFYSRTVTLDSVKDFVPSFFQACDWVKQNLPEDANMFSLNTYPTRYNCDRPAVWEIPDKADILLSNNLTLVKDRLEANGIGYIFVQKFSLSNAPLAQAYPVSFVQFLEGNNETFEKIYENGPQFGTQQFQSCVGSGGCDPGNIIYRVR